MKVKGIDPGTSRPSTRNTDEFAAMVADDAQAGMTFMCAKLFEAIGATHLNQREFSAS
jgi:hypothetical protein